MGKGNQRKYKLGLMKIERVKIIDTEPTSNGWVYPLPVLEKIYQKILSAQPHERFGEFGFPSGHTVDMDNVAFIYDNPQLEENELFVDINILETESGETLKELFTEVKFAPVGLGLVQDDIMGEDYEFLSICAYNPQEK